jgi:enoyl-CoA hydratase/carnithine racemase
MTAYETIDLRHHEAFVEIAFNRPDALNAITPLMLDELVVAFTKLADDPPPVAVLTGRGRAFSAGVDLKALGDATLAGGAVGEPLDSRARALTTLICEIDCVVIAKVNGYCFTGALELALACDLVVAANEAIFGDTHAKFGLRPTWGMSQRLPHLVGFARARELSYTAATFTGAEAAAWGLACRSYPRGALDEAVQELALQIRGNSVGSLRAYKDLYGAATRTSSLAEGLAYEAAASYTIDDTAGRIAGFR